MKSNFFSISALKAARVTMVIIFLALIRSLVEPFRMQYYSRAPVVISSVRIFLVGALVAGLGLLVMTVLFFGGKYKWNLAVGAATLLSLSLIKSLI